jgi:CO dehydrogenase/acetyl-CoA synthase alpha subunit
MFANIELENVTISIGEVREDEGISGAVKPPYIALRAWDYFLFSRYKPKYVVENIHEHVKTLFSLTVAGTSSYIAIARNRLDYAYQRLGKNARIELGLDIEAPLIRTLIGIRPKKLSDLETVMSYVTKEFAETTASIHSMNEANSLDFESKMFHLGFLSLLAMEVAEIPYMMLSDNKEQTLKWGIGLVDPYKPTIFVVGDVPAVVDIVEYAKKLGNSVEVVAGGCYALDMWRITSGNVKIVCTQSGVVDFIRSGVPDVVVVGECGSVPIDVVRDANCKMISSSSRACLGLPDLTASDEDKILEKLEKGIGAIITDPKKLAKVSVALAVGISAKRKSGMKIDVSDEVYKAKPPFGAFPEHVIRDVGVPIVMGTIPGVVAVVGCSFFDVNELGYVVENLAKRKYLILTTGCTALQLSKYKPSEIESLYDFENIILMGSPTSVAHIAGLALKVGAIFARLTLDGNGLEVLDYLLNRVGAVGLSWSKPNESTVAMAWGVLRAGIPVVVGKNLAVAGRLFLGDVSDARSFEVFDNKTKRRVFAPTPEHLLCLANDSRETLVLISKLVMRPNDGVKSRAIKVNNYIDFYSRFYNELPSDLHLFVRSQEEVPPMRREEILEFLKSKDWKPAEPSTIDPTIIPIISSVLDGETET